MSHSETRNDPCRTLEMIYSLGFILRIIVRHFPYRHQCWNYHQGWSRHFA